MLNADPASINPTYRVKPTSTYFDSYDPPTNCPTAQANPPIPCLGAAASVGTIQAYIHFPPFTRMPPQPAEALSDWELKLLDNWTGPITKLKTPPKP